MSAGTLFVVPVINTMGPVIDPRHTDLLNTWDEVFAATDQYFDETYRNRYPDSRGGPAVLSWFFISWSGFTSNPVHRDFGWFNIYDRYRTRYGDLMDGFGDRLHWMYNHPPASGVGNEWGLDWLHNAHYFEILNRYVIERSYFPSAVEIPTEKNDASNWIEQWFPFDFGNRNCRDLNLQALEADGKTTGSVLDWSLAPDDWSEYHPNHDDYRRPGSMRRTVFRLLDIKTRIYQLKPEEIEKAFLRCQKGHNTLLAAYEHDFRDRSQVVQDLLIKPVADIAKRFPDVEWRYADALAAAQAVTGVTDHVPPVFEVEPRAEDILIGASESLFGPMPYVVSKDLDRGAYRNHPLRKVGATTWSVNRHELPPRCSLGVAANDPSGNAGVAHYRLERDVVEVEVPPREAVC